MPFTALIIRAVLAWRFVEISRSVMRCVDEDQTASAAVLTRSALETSGAAWYLNDQLQRALDKGAIGNTDDSLGSTREGAPMAHLRDVRGTNRSFDEQE